MIKAIETEYQNYRFRSRLEARWAVFLDTLGIKWEYEKEGYDLDGTWYLPDFWLPEQECWIEIKGETPTEKDIHKCCKLAKHASLHYEQNKRLYIFAGNIPLVIPGDATSGCVATNIELSSYEEGTCYLDSGYGWTECPFCNTVGITKGGSIVYLCECAKEKMRIFDIDGMLVHQKQDEHKREALSVCYEHKRRTFLSWYDTPRLLEAYRTARQARFEFDR